MVQEVFGSFIKNIQKHAHVFKWLEFLTVMLIKKVKLVKLV